LHNIALTGYETNYHLLIFAYCTIIHQKRLYTGR